MDAAVASTIQEGDEFVCIGGGKCGERFSDIVKRYGGIVREVPVQWGRTFDTDEVEKVVSESSAKAITLTHNETSTGVLHDAGAVGKIAKKYDSLFILDAITSLGGDYVKTDEWEVDLCIGGSQKCLGAPPGLSMVAVSDRAWNVIENNDTKNYYLNLASYRKSLKKNTTPFTPSVNLIYGLSKALKEIIEEGLDNRVKRHQTLAKATREAAGAMNLELFADQNAASNTVTSIKIPDGMTDDDIRGEMKRKFNILMAGGQERLKGKIFRIGHMGNVGYLELISVLSALELVLQKGGHDLQLGNGVKAAQEVLQ
ncbi:MAG: alanine--glyoxylate aminotransferase family protein, partial [Candidatus Hydrothermarchaeaceae archaeon]